MRPTSPSLLVLLVVLPFSMPACVQTISNLSPEDAATGLSTASGFTTRAGSPVGRELIEVVAVRRIGRSSTEVEFTWRNTGGGAAGATTSPAKTSMALFRLRAREVSGLSSLMVRLHLQEPAEWALSSLYKVD